MLRKWVWLGLTVSVLSVTGCKSAPLAVEHSDLPEPCKTFFWHRYEATPGFDGGVALAPADADTLFLNVTQLKYCYKKAQAVIQEYNKERSH